VKTLRRHQHEQFETWSKFVFEHASDFNRIVRALPDFVPRGLDRRLPFMPASLDRIRAEMLVIDKLFQLGHVKPNPCLGTQPVIYDAPEEWHAGDTHTITGEGFGPAAGTVLLDLHTPRGSAFPPAGTSIPLSVLSWSNTAVRAQAPTAIPAGIPLTAGGQLVLTRADVSCSDAVRIVFKPPHIFLRGTSGVVAAAGANLGSSYSRSHTLTSPVLPPRAEPHLFGPSVTPTQDVFLILTSTQFTYGGDDPPTTSVTSGPSFTSNRERTITVTVNDDWAHNYSLRADFTIIQPADEVIAAGWAVTP
jgi:hypothetical protein